MKVIEGTKIIEILIIFNYLQGRIKTEKKIFCNLVQVLFQLSGSTVVCFIGRYLSIDLNMQMLRVYNLILILIYHNHFRFLKVNNYIL